MKRAYSYTALSTYERCPAQYGFKLQRKKAERGEPLTLGIASHTAISQYVAHCWREQVRADPDAVNPIVDGLTGDKKAPLPEAFRRDVREVLNEFAGSYVLNLVRPQVEVALPFDLDWTLLGDWWSKNPPVRFRAKMDLIERPSQDRIVITDWKTGHYVPTSSELLADDQLLTYAFASSKRWPSVSTFEVRLYYCRQQWEHGPFEFQREELEDFGKDLERRMAVADAETKFAPVPGDHCQRCDWRRHCPGYREAAMGNTIPEDPLALAGDYFLAQARFKDLKAAVKARTENGPIPTPSGKWLGFVQSLSWSIDETESVVSDLVEHGNVGMDLIWPKLTLSKTSLAKLLRGIGEEEMVGAFLDNYGSASIKNTLKEHDPSPEED